MGVQIGLESRCALALGAKGLVFETAYGNDSQFWYPLRAIGPANPLGDQVKTINADLEKVCSAFIDTQLLEAGVYGSSNVFESATGKITLPCGVLGTISNQSAPLLISRLRGFGKEFFVVLNLSATSAQTLYIYFDEIVTNLNPAPIAVKPPIIGKGVTLPSPEETEDSTFTSVLPAGGWRVFSYNLPVKDFGLSTR